MKSILVVDDEQGLRLGLELILAAEGFHVLTASNGEEALLTIRDSHPDLVLLDIMMPGLGGLETLKMLRAHPNFKKIPVIMMSGARPLVKQSDYGWSAFLTKPFQGEQVIQLINKLI